MALRGHGLRVVLFMLACVVLFGAGRVMGERSSLSIKPGGARPTPLVLFAEGEILPDGIIYAHAGAPVRFPTVLDGARNTAILLFNLSCGRCVAEATEWQRLQREHANKLAFVGIASLAEPSGLDSLRASSGVNFPLYRSDSRFPKELRAAGLPTVYVVDATRRVLFRSAGPTAILDLAEWLHDEADMRPMSPTADERL